MYRLLLSITLIGLVACSEEPATTESPAVAGVAAMQPAETQPADVNYPDEGHGFARPENNMSFFATSEGFLSNCLGGRYEPIGDDFDGSSVRVLKCAEHVPGLSEVVAGSTGE